jgi:predicted O-methyltransferase YrrM
MKKNTHGDIILGPLLDQDEAFLKAIIGMTNPMVVVEFGFLWGDSARGMLEVMDENARLYSFDCTKDGVIDDPRFTFFKKSQEEIEGIENIDFVFLDASHDLVLNQKTFEKLMDSMSEKGIIAIHDTGTWVGGNVFNAEMGHMNKKGEWVHCPDEILFVNWIKEKYPEWQQIHFHSSRQVRHGITLLQKTVTLSDK